MHTFEGDTYLLKRKILVILGGAFSVLDGNGKVVAYARQRVKLREDIRLYTDESQSTEVLRIAARKIVDFSAAYDVIDSATGQKVGALRRRGMRSIVRDLWTVLDVEDNEIGTVEEDSTALALVRRFLTNLVPQNYAVTVGGNEAARFSQRFNPLLYNLDITFTGPALDRRLGIAAAVLLAAVEGRQAN